MPLLKIGGVMAPAIPTKFDKAGGTITGNVMIDAPDSASLVIDKAASAQVASLRGQTNGLSRWQADLGDSAAESGGNAGSDFFLRRFSDAGAQLGLAMGVRRSDGEAFFEKIPRIGGFSNAPMMEVGSNANGKYWRFANGLQVCLQNSQYLTVGAVTNLDWTYPISFVGNPYVMAHTQQGAGNDPRNTNTTTTYGYNFANWVRLIYITYSQVSAQLMAIGAWK